MITVQQATAIISEVAFRPRTASEDIDMATGYVLAGNIVADRDLPPFHRSTMDGIAIRFSDYEKGVREFVIEGLQAAGQPQQALKSGCIEIMTGGILPEGSDTVVRYEDVTINAGKATINAAVEKNQSVHAKGIDCVEGEILLKPGTLITAAEIALMASVGKKEIEIYEVDPIAIVTTGDEVVPIEATPAPYQIRRSNGVSLSAALDRMQIDSIVTHLPDDAAVLEREIKKIIEKHDVIILSGGVSKGKFDYIPGILEKLGIKKAFHQVQQRPGKPFWFGRSETKTVFALPGNPVSTFLCFHRYIKPWLQHGLGLRSGTTRAILAEDFIFKPDLTYFLQVKIDTSNGQLMATPDAGEGSGDFANLRNVDGFIELPTGRSEFKKGELFPYISFR